MPWQRIDPRHLRQRNPDCPTIAYADTGGHDVGHRLLDPDGDGRVAAFQLSYERFLAGRELVADWSRERGLRLGEVDTDRDRASFEPRVKPSPLVRYYAQPPVAEVATLLTYVAECGSALTADQYEVADGV